MAGRTPTSASTRIPRQQGQASGPRGACHRPGFPVGAHTASLGLIFYRGSAFPVRYHGGAFVAQRGSWNRSSFAGYRVIFVPFRDGRPSGPLEEFLTGFIANAEAAEVYGRPVGLAVLRDGSLLVADDAGNKIWRVTSLGLNP